jgi:NDP-sugar pyrophosphorylase family protein
MIAVIVLPGPSRTMHGLDAQRSLALLPLGDRPIIQQIIDSLIPQGITQIEFLVAHTPELIEAHLGNGDRWGCTFRYHLTADPAHPYRSLRIIPNLEATPWVLVHAERFPCEDFRDASATTTTLYYGSFSTALEDAHLTRPATPEPPHWGGTAIFPAQFPLQPFLNHTTEEFTTHLQSLASTRAANIVICGDWIDASTPANLLMTQQMLLNHQLHHLAISAAERQPGVYISRNVTIDPTATLMAPAYIGPNCRIHNGAILGPNVVIGKDCVIGSGATIENSLVTEGSYVGEGLELQTAIVSQNLLVNVRLDTMVRVSEPFLLGRVATPRRRSRFSILTQALLALVLIVLFLPITLLSLLYFALVRGTTYAAIEVCRLPLGIRVRNSRNFALPCLGADAWAVQRPAGWSAFLRQFLPGLYAILCGRLSFVGLPPKTPAQIRSISNEWRDIYSEGGGGLITEASLTAADTTDQTQLFLADAFYQAHRSHRYNLKLAARYFAALVIPRNTPA